MGAAKCCGAPKSALSISAEFEARPVGEWSLAGAQTKFSAVVRARVHCTACDWSATGYVEDAVVVDGVFVSGSFIVDR